MRSNGSYETRKVSLGGGMPLQTGGMTEGSDWPWDQHRHAPVTELLTIDLSVAGRYASRSWCVEAMTICWRS